MKDASRPVQAAHRRIGGDIETMRFLDGLAIARRPVLQDAAKTLVEECVREHEMPAGFGHRFTRATRARRGC
jgi:hypothetical protein